MEEGEKLGNVLPRGWQPIFSIKVCRPSDNAQIVGHFSMEISRTTHFILQRGTTVSANICQKHYNGTSLVQGGLEVPCQITVCIPGSVVNHRRWSRCETLLRNLNIEPKDGEIMGTFLFITESLREAEPLQPQRKKNKERKLN